MHEFTVVTINLVQIIYLIIKLKLHTHTHTPQLVFSLFVFVQNRISTAEITVIECYSLSEIALKNTSEKTWLI